MKICSTSKLLFLPVLLCSVSLAPLAASAQNDGSNGPPNILVVQREFTKPGRSGMPHERTEGAYRAAAEAGKSQEHYLGMVALSGPDRALFFSGYASFADWESAMKSNAGNASLSASIDRANVADGDVLSSADSSVWRFQPDMSMNTHNLMGVRYMQIESYKIKPGHDAEWEESVKMVIGGYKKGVPDASWAMFKQVFGTGGDAYVVIVSLKSLGELDEHHMHAKDFEDAMGKEGLAKLDQLMASCVESEQSNLFQFNPKMSYVPDAWKQAEPDYWNPKPTGAVKHPQQ